MVSGVGGGRNPEQAKELGKATEEDEGTMMSSARSDRTPGKQVKDTGKGTSKVTTRIGYVWDVDQLKPLSATMVPYELRAFTDLRHHQGERKNNYAMILNVEGVTIN